MAVSPAQLPGQLLCDSRKARVGKFVRPSAYSFPDRPTTFLDIRHHGIEEQGAPRGPLREKRWRAAPVRRPWPYSPFVLTAFCDI